MKFFSTSRTLFRDPSHPLYMSIDPSKAVNRFVVVDPMDPTGLLYLTQRAYEKYSLVQKSNEDELVVLLRPGELFMQTRDSRVPPGPKGGGATGSSNASGSSITPVVKRQRMTILESLREAFRMFQGIFRTMPRDSEDDGLLAMSEGRHLQHLIKRFGYITYLRLGGQVSGSGSLKTRKDLAYTARHLRKILKTRGLNFLIKYMKVSLHALTASISGNPHKGTAFLGTPVKLGGQGLPVVLSPRARDQIRSRNLEAIRLYTTILSTYKAFSGVGPPIVDFASIMAEPFTGDLTEYKGFVSEFFDWIKSFHDPDDIPMLSVKPGDILLHDTGKAGPNGPYAIIAAGLDALALKYHPELDQALRKLSKAIGVLAGIYYPILDIRKYIEKGPIGKLVSITDRRKAKVVGKNTYIKDIVPVDPTKLFLGKLSLKKEAAGKVRVFAIIDYWSQTVLKHLHVHLYKFLRALPTDGTYDQNTSVESFTTLFEGWEIFSFDLTAATDLMPIQLHTVLLEEMCGSAISEPWTTVITERLFKLPFGSAVPEKIRAEYPQGVKYTRGQPMGALTSWAILALTHHCLVQLAAKRVGLFPTNQYRVLGDDIVIAGKDLAVSYREVCKDFGLSLNNKGFESYSTFLNPNGPFLTEFAKQTRLGTVDISAISLKEELSIRTLSQRVEQLKRSVIRGVIDIMSNNSVASIFRMALTSVKVAKQLVKAISKGRIPGPFRALLTVLLYPSWKSADTQVDRLDIRTPLFFSKEAPFVPWLLATYANGIMENQASLFNGESEIAYDSVPYRAILRSLANTLVADYVKLVDQKRLSTHSNILIADSIEFTRICFAWNAILEAKGYDVYSIRHVRRLLKLLVYERYESKNSPWLVGQSYLNDVRILKNALDLNDDLTGGQCMLLISEILHLMSKTPTFQSYEYRKGSKFLEMLEDLATLPEYANYFANHKKDVSPRTPQEIAEVLEPVNPFLRDSTNLERFRARAEFVTIDSMIYHHTLDVNKSIGSRYDSETLNFKRGRLDFSVRILGSSSNPSNLSGVRNIQESDSADPAVS